MITCLDQLVIRCTVHVLRNILSTCVCSPFRFGFEGEMWAFIVLIPDHCLSVLTKSMSTRIEA